MAHDASQSRLLQGENRECGHGIPKLCQNIMIAVAGGVAIGVSFGACYAIVTLMGDSKMNPFDMNFGVDPVGGNPSSGELTCGETGSTDWQALSSLDPGSKVAIRKSLLMLQAERRNCPGGAFPKLPLQAQDFELGENHSKSAHVHHKFASTCGSETFKVHFFMGPESKLGDGEVTSFSVEAFRDISTDGWRLLKSTPTPCNVKVGTTASPETWPQQAKYTKDAASFATNEWAYQMKQKGCLGDTGSVKLVDVVQARALITAGLDVEMVLRISVQHKENETGSTRTVQVIVQERCDNAHKGSCVKELALPESVDGVCSIDELTAPVLRKLSNRGRFGHIAPDATESLVAQRELLEPRRLRSSGGHQRPPLVLRHIKTGRVPAEYDPRPSECFRNIMVYDQGQCGSCYANAIAQMIGIRMCLKEQGMPGKSRRLHASSLFDRNISVPARVLKGEHSEPKRARTTMKGCKCKKRWKHDGVLCKDHCCNPDDGEGDWCFVEDEACEGVNWGYCMDDAPQPSCNDSASWTDSYGDGCEWYKAHDPGCEKYEDQGQLTHCEQTCNTCPTVHSQNSGSSPSDQSLVNYMVSVSDIAPCSQGCNGGSTQSVWNDWMRKVNRDLWIMEEKCKPYDLKCWSIDGGVVNPSLGWSQCSKYSDYEQWHKPCTCIPAKVKPHKMTCPAAKPASKCGHPVPLAFFDVASMEHGLSNEEAVLNMQRHIFEYGPIYVSFDVHSNFMNWDWSLHPVYTGGGGNEGGHAVLAVGWGKRHKLDYWLLRNSWGADYADHGYFKFQRGVNLGNVESSEITASMPDQSYTDWSAPICDITRFSRSWSTWGSKLISYTLKVTMVCNKDTNLNVFFSERIDNRVDLYNGGGLSGTTENKQVKATTPTEIGVDLVCWNFGLKAGETWIHVKSVDASDNVAETSHFIAVPPVPNMRTSSCSS